MSELRSFLANHDLEALSSTLADCGIERIADLRLLDASDYVAMGVPEELCDRLMDGLSQEAPPPPAAAPRSAASAESDATAPPPSAPSAPVPSPLHVVGTTRHAPPQ